MARGGGKMLSLRASSKPETSSKKTTNCTRKREEEEEAGKKKAEKEEHLLGQLKTHDDRQRNWRRVLRFAGAVWTVVWHLPR